MGSSKDARRNLLPIGKFARMSRASIKSIRYYESIGALQPAWVDPQTGYRYYSINQIYELDLIRICVEESVPIADLRSYYTEGDIFDAERFFKSCADLARTRLRTARATTLKMDSYIEACRQQLTAQMLQIRPYSTSDQLLLAKPMENDLASLRYQDYLSALSSCLRIACERDIITLASQGVIRQSDSRWFAYVEAYDEEDVLNKLRAEDDFLLMLMPATSYQARSHLGSDTERCFANACQTAQELNATRIQEAWAYSLVTAIYAFDVLSPLELEG